MMNTPWKLPPSIYPSEGIIGSLRHVCEHHTEMILKLLQSIGEKLPEYRIHHQEKCGIAITTLKHITLDKNLSPAQWFAITSDKAFEHTQTVVVDVKVMNIIRLI